MPISQAMCTSFKAEILLGVHDFRATSGDTFKLALYTSSANLGATTTAYTTLNETTGTNYTAGGAQLANLGGAVTSGTTGLTDFSDLTFSNVSLTAAGALIYNTTPSALSNAGGTLTNPAVCALNFGSDKTATAGDFTIIFPAATSADAIIRIA
jgi:hypothetical protein